MPKVSVIMSTYNESEAFIQASIRSLIAQTFNDFEVIVVIDNPDNEKIYTILDQLLKEDPLNRIRIIQNEKNLGLARSLNVAARYASSKYIARMDADDVSFPNRFETEVSYLEQHPEVTMTFTNVKYIDEDGNPTGEPFSIVPNRVYVNKLMNYMCPVTHPTVMIRRNAFVDMNGYNNLPTAQDYDLWTRMIKKGYTIEGIDQPLLLYRIRKGSITSNQWRTYLYATAIRSVEKRATNYKSSIDSENKIKKLVRRRGLYSNIKKEKFYRAEKLVDRGKQLIKSRSNIFYGSLLLIIAIVMSNAQFTQILNKRAVIKIFREYDLSKESMSFE